MDQHYFKRSINPDYNLDKCTQCGMSHEGVVHIQKEEEVFDVNEGVFDVIDRPSHYTSGKVEVWDFILDQELSYCLGNVVKYVSRAGKKESGKHLEDLGKAKAFLEREIRRLSDEASCR